MRFSFLLSFLLCFTLLSAQTAKKPHSGICWTIDPKETKIDTGRSRGLIDNFLLWENGKVLSVYFMNGSQKLQEQILAYAKEWEQFANISFVVSRDSNLSHIRVKLAEESHSYVGTMALSLSSENPTMWVDTFSAGNKRQYRATVLHEFGHVLGLLHEHKHPVSGIKWNYEEIYRRIPNDCWGDERNNQQDFWRDFLEQQPSYYANGTPYDSKSVMHYPILPWMTKDGYSAGWNFEISEGDKQIISKMYPKTGDREPDGAVRIEADVNNVLIVDQPGRGYLIKVHGKFIPKTDGIVFLTVNFFDSLGNPLADDDEKYQVSGQMAAVEKIQINTGKQLPAVIETILPYDQLKLPDGRKRLITQAKIYYYSSDREELRTLYASTTYKITIPSVKLKPVAQALPKGNQQTGRRTLGVPIVQQRTLVWCWLAVGEMLFRYYRVPAVNRYDYQCGIIGLIYQPCYINCTNRNCIIPAGSTYGMINMLREYPRLAASRSINFSAGRELSLQSVINNINAGRPIVCGISPNSRAYNRESEHAVLITGYDYGPNGAWLIVNDPYPYPSSQNPYFRNGGTMVSNNQYAVPYANFTIGMCWNWSASSIRL